MKILSLVILSLLLIGCSQVQPKDSLEEEIPQENTIPEETNENITESGIEGTQETPGVSEAYNPDTSLWVSESDAEMYLNEQEQQMQEQRKKSEWLDFIGLIEEAAQSLAAENNVSFRVVERDGESLPVTMDYRPGRINATIENWIISSFSIE